MLNQRASRGGAEAAKKEQIADVEIHGCSLDLPNEENHQRKL
jgi:hypothetical protein